MPVSNVITNLCRPLQLSPAQKAVLMALADRADDDGVAWPSVAWVSEWTCLGRSTVMRAVVALEAMQLIVMVRAEGRTSCCSIVIGNVVLASADPPRSGTPTRPAAEPVDEGEQASDPARSGTGAGGEEGGDPYQSGTRPDAGPVPLRDTHPSRSGTPTRPALTHPRPAAGPDTSITTNKTSEKTKKASNVNFDPMTVVLPDWMPTETWGMWARYRAETKKPITEDGARLQLAKLAKFRDEGHDAVRVVEAAIENRWQGLYVPKDGSTRFAQAGGGNQVVCL